MNVKKNEPTLSLYRRLTETNLDNLHYIESPYFDTCHIRCIKNVRASA